MRSRAATGLAALLFSACGGGGGSQSGGSSPPPPPANTPPQITSSSAVTVAENSSSVVLTATATDADDDTIDFTIAGGADAEAFNIDGASGAVTFASAPDFESPADSDGDNVYVFTLEASDGRGGTASQTVTVNVSDVDETGAGVRYRDVVFADVTAERSVPFATVGALTLRMDIFTPDNDTATDRPVMILAFPGGFIEGDREDVEDLAVDFARRGYVGVTIDYRLRGSAPANETEFAVAAYRATHDLFAAVRYVRADAAGSNTYGTRADAIFVGGVSAGGVMSALAAVLDPGDTFSNAGVQTFLDNNGGVFGTVGDNDSVSSGVQGALVIAGAVLEASHIDSGSAPIHAGHQEFDPIVPCGTGEEGEYFTGLSLTGPCAMQPVFDGLGVPFGLSLVTGAAGHIDFSDDDIDAITEEAADLFYTAVISAD